MPQEKLTVGSLISRNSPVQMFSNQNNVHQPMVEYGQGNMLHLKRGVLAKQGHPSWIDEEMIQKMMVA